MERPSTALVLALALLLVPLRPGAAGGEEPVTLLVNDADAAHPTAGAASLRSHRAAAIGLGWSRLEVPASTAAEVAADLRRRGVAVEVDAPVHALRTPSDPRWDEQWGPRAVQAPSLWEVARGTRGTTIAVLDTGVDEVADLQGKLLPGRDLVDGDHVADDRSHDRHGTQAALVAAATANDDHGIAGYCWRCAVLPVRVLDARGDGRMSHVVEGIVWAVDQGADVINLSLGIQERELLEAADGDPDGVQRRALDDAIEHAVDNGVLVVAAAGNLATEDRLWPAAHADVIGVGATTRTGALSPYSNRGDWVDVGAPGCHVALPREPEFCGTSSAAPAVAGAVAAALSAPVEPGPRRIRRRLLDTADDLAGTAHGRIDLLAFATGLDDGRPLVGDWNGDGTDTPGTFANGRWYLSDDLEPGATRFVSFGRAGDVPVVGDWNGDGTDTIGIVRDGTWHLRDSLAGGAADRSFTYGRVSRGDLPLVGDWNGDRVPGPAIVRAGTWLLRDRLSGGAANHRLAY